jgi:hypothetical protein
LFTTFTCSLGNRGQKRGSKDARGIAVGAKKVSTPLSVFKPEYVITNVAVAHKSGQFVCRRRSRCLIINRGIYTKRSPVSFKDDVAYARDMRRSRTSRFVAKSMQVHAMAIAPSAKALSASGVTQ